MVWRMRECCDTDLNEPHEDDCYTHSFSSSEGRRNDDALYNSRPLTDSEKMDIGYWSGIEQGRGDSMG